MKRIDYFHRLLRPVLLPAAALLLAAACTTDNDPGNDGTNDPSSGTVPFTFTALPPAAITDARDADATTRAVSGKDAWKGDGTEKIGVAIVIGDICDPVDTPQATAGTYTIISAEGDITVATGDEPAFWQGKARHSLTAWYPGGEGTYDISDQSTPDKLRQADLLRAVQKGMYYDFGSKPALQFMHWMAKVRVELTGVPSSSEGDIKVEIGAYTGVVILISGFIVPSYTGYITACRDTSDPNVVAFEALCPSIDKTLLKQNFIRITAAGKTYSFNPGTDSPQKLEDGKRYTYRLSLPATTRAADAAATTRAAAPVPLPAPVVAPF